MKFLAKMFGRADYIALVEENERLEKKIASLEFQLEASNVRQQSAQELAIKAMELSAMFLDKPKDSKT